jgi:hypothetical protein
MPLVLDPNSLAPEVLVELRRSLRDDLAETRRMVEEPRGKVLDPASLATASELLTATLVRLELPPPESASALASDVNLAYATLLAVIDLVKSHTDVPKVPRKLAPS